jgi:prepilin-type N-terminal cleavage/methylation domain-containing protein
MSSNRGAARPHESGFTLVELLGVITVLGILSGLTLVALVGFRSTSAQATCAVDARSLIGAEDTAMATTGSYLSEADLVSQGFLREPVSSYDISLSGSTYSVAPTGDCTASGTVGVTTTTAPATTTTTTTTTSTTTTTTMPTTTTTPPTTTTSPPTTTTKPPTVTATIKAVKNKVVTVTGTASGSGGVTVTIYRGAGCTNPVDSVTVTPSGGAYSTGNLTVGNGDRYARATQGSVSSTCSGPAKA